MRIKIQPKKENKEEYTEAQLQTALWWLRKQGKYFIPVGSPTSNRYYLMNLGSEKTIAGMTWCVGNTVDGYCSCKAMYEQIDRNYGVDITLAQDYELVVYEGDNDD